MNLFEYAKNYVVIKTENGNRSLNDKELETLREFQEKMDTGLQPRLIKLRRGPRLTWY